MTGIYGDLGNLRAMMAATGVRRLYAKRLASNDNSKNQIYLGSSFEALNVLPFGDIYDDSSEKNQILKAPLKFEWLRPDGARSPAPHAQLILYPQYPEVRMSGILKAAPDGPRNLMVSRDAGRVMFLGIDDHGVIVAAVAPSDDPAAVEFESTVAGQADSLFYDLAVGVAFEDARNALISELKRIHELGWIDSKRLKADGSLGPCTAPNCGGYTLEAELGVKPNSISAPDFLGWEVKQHTVSNLNRPESGGPITLMTPEPTGGYYRERGVEAFLRKYGYKDRMGRADRINFGGIYRVDQKVPLTGLTMVLAGYDATSGKITDSNKGITLLDVNGDAAATWGYAGLIQHWARKHERAVYVPSEKRMEPRLQYRYARLVLLGMETDFSRFLQSISAGDIYYDPGIKLEGASTGSPRIKRRSQFRVKWKKLPALYKATPVVDLLAS